ncbi:MAG: response regulator transcription factor [Actinobacteria bacterium]|nr:response regulator transcription factor [Actinomycetota bacterium]
MKVLICDDHRLFAEAFAYVLATGGHEVIGCVASPDEAVQTVAANDVEVCVMDLHFPTGSGVEGIARVLAASPATRVVALTGNSEPFTLATAIGAGAHGVAVKEHDIHQVIRTVERVHAGETVGDECRWSAKNDPLTSGDGDDDGARRGGAGRDEEAVFVLDVDPDDDLVGHGAPADGVSRAGMDRPVPAVEATGDEAPEHRRIWVRSGTGATTPDE